jgi:hypothetical protein
MTDFDKIIAQAQGYMEELPRRKCALESCNNEATHVFKLRGLLGHWATHRICQDHAPMDSTPIRKSLRVEDGRLIREDS